MLASQNRIQRLKNILRWGMIILSVMLIVLVFGSPGAGSRPLVPSLVPFIKWQLGLIFLLFQILFCYFYRIRYGLLVILVVWAIAVPSIYIGADFRWSPLSLSGFDRIITGSSCLSGLAIGIAILKRKL